MEQVGKLDFKYVLFINAKNNVTWINLLIRQK